MKLQAWKLWFASWWPFNRLLSSWFETKNWKSNQCTETYKKKNPMCMYKFHIHVLNNHGIKYLFNLKWSFHCTTPVFKIICFWTKIHKTLFPLVRSLPLSHYLTTRNISSQQAKRFIYIIVSISSSSISSQLTWHYSHCFFQMLTDR